MRLSKTKAMFVPHTLTNYGYIGTEEIDHARLIVLNFILAHPEVCWVIRLRYQCNRNPEVDDRDFYYRWIRDGGVRNVSLSWAQRIDKAMRDIDVVIVQHSSVAIEAAEIGKHVILMEDELSRALEEFDELPNRMFRRANDALSLERAFYQRD